jgi:fucose permease
MLVTWRTVAESTGDDVSRKIDYRGIVTLSLGLIALLLALDNGPEEGWGDPLIVGLFCISGLLLVAFGYLEPRAGEGALVPEDVLRTTQFTMAALSVLMMSAIFFAALLYLPQFMTKILGYSALRSGAGLLPMMLVFAASSFTAGPLYNRLGPKLIVSIGATALAVGMFLLSFLDADTEYIGLVPGMMVLGVGVGVFYSSITTAGVTALDPSRSSLAGGIIYMCQIAGGAIGLGLNTAIVASADSLSEGIGTAFKVDAVLAVIGLVVSVLFVGGTVDRERLRTLRGHHRAHA